MNVLRQARRRSAVLAIGLLGCGAVLAIAASLWATSAAPKAVGAPAVGDTALELIGRDDQPDLSHAVFYGYVTHLSGIPDSALFASAARSEATARITFRVDLLLDAHLALQPLFVTTGTGTLTFYFQASPGGAKFGSPQTFSTGTPIATAPARFHDILNAQSESTGIETSTGTIVQKTAVTFTVGGKQYRFGRIGQRERFTTSGEGLRQTTPTVTRTIIASGEAVVTR